MDDNSKKMKKLLALDDCDRPACDDVQSMFQKAAAAAEASRTSSTSSSTVVVEKKATMKSACPAGSAELGRSTWTLLHSMVRV